MKILYFITKSNWGGAQRHVFDLATSMKDRGHDVAVALGGNGLLRTKLEEAGIFTHSIESLNRDISLKDDLVSFKDILSIIRHRRPDVLHLHSPKAAGIGSVAGRLLRVPKIITTVHGWSWNEQRPWFEKILIACFSWFTVLLSHRTIVISQRDHDQILHFPATHGRVTLARLGMKTPIFVSIDGAKQTIAKLAQIELGDFNKRTVIGTIAELHPNKGLSYLIHAFSTVVSEHSQALLIIIGDGQDRASLESLIKEKGLEKNVILLGYMDHAAEYLKAFTIFALSSVKEGLPYVILEAGSASLPVVATTVGGIPEVVEDMRSGVLVQPKNVRELAHALSFMIEHPVERKKYGSVLKERVTTNFSLEKMIEEVVRVYN